MTQNKILEKIIQINQTRPAEQGDLIDLVDSKETLLLHLTFLYNNDKITATSTRISHKKEDAGKILDFAGIVATGL